MRGPQPGMRPGMMRPQQNMPRGQVMPGQPNILLQQQAQQQQQQRFRMQQVRGPIPTNTSGEPLRPHFPPQQPMVMRMPITSGGHPMQMAGQVQQQQPPQMQTGGVPTTMMMGGPGQQPHMQPHPMRPPPPGMATASLRLSIPPQQAMPPQPRTPGSTGSQQPSPALSGRSDVGDEMMDSNSSRGQCFWLLTFYLSTRCLKSVAILQYYYNLTCYFGIFYRSNSRCGRL